MKRIAIILSILLTAGVLLWTSAIQPVKAKKIVDHKIINIDKPVEPRHSITFILGKDKEEDNPYYAQATNYFRYHPHDKTEEVVTWCETLKDVMDFLLENPPSNGRPWGMVNLVVHGNQWLGLGLPVAHGLRRATPDRIYNHIEDGTLKPLPDTLLDEKTELFLHGCGIGNNTHLMDAVSLAFGGENARPAVRASRLFEYYTSTTKEGAQIESQRFFAKAWFVQFRMGEKPEKKELINAFKNNYPSDTLNWSQAICREEPRFNGDSYHYTFEVPVLWLAEYNPGDTVPDLTSDSARLAWVNTQPELLEVLNKIEIEADKFVWKARKIFKKNEQGERIPAVWANGFCTVLCVVQPIVHPTVESEPFIPSLNDTTYFCMR